MKTPNILILCTAFLVSMPSTDAQSFKDGLKSLGDKIGKQIVKTTQSVKNQTTRRKQDFRQGQGTSEAVRCNDGKCS